MRRSMVRSMGRGVGPRPGRSITPKPSYSVGKTVYEEKTDKDGGGVKAVADSLLSFFNL